MNPIPGSTFDIPLVIDGNSESEESPAFFSISWTPTRTRKPNRIPILLKILPPLLKGNQETRNLKTGSSVPIQNHPEFYAQSKTSQIYLPHKLMTMLLQINSSIVCMKQICVSGMPSSIRTMSSTLLL